MDFMDTDDLYALALSHHQEGRIEEAEKVYQLLLKIEPTNHAVLHDLGIIEYQRGNYQSSADFIQAAIMVDGSNSTYHYHHGVALQLMGQLDAAGFSYEQAIKILPDYPDAYNNLAFIHHYNARFAEAESCFRCVLKSQPEHAEVWSNLGNVLKAVGRIEEAVEAYNRAIELKPVYLDAHYNLGIALQELGELDKAVASYNAALAINPNYAKALNNLGNALQEQGKIAEAILMFKRVLGIDPQHVDAMNNLAGSYQVQGDTAESLEINRKVLLIDPAHQGAFSNTMMSLQYLPDSVDERVRLARMFGVAFNASAVAEIPSDLSLGKKLRIGYVSGNFGNHPVGFLLTKVLAAHDKTQFEVYGYTNGLHRDNTARKIYDCCDQWRDLFALNDDQAAEVIRNDCIDILIDCDGHTAGNRLTMFALRPAPIQVSWIGYMGSTGLAAMDYILLDEATCPANSTEWFSEEIVRLPYGRFCFEPLPDTPDVSPPPCLKNGFITFGSFTNPVKINPDVIRLWSRVLAAVPDSRLLIKWKSLADPGMRDLILNGIRDEGIDVSRVELRGWSPHIDALAEYSDVDIALDSFPFSGGMTSMEALWMGVPIITLPGEQPASRQTYSMLKIIKLDDLYAFDEDNYVSIAIRLAYDTEHLAIRRREQRGKMAASAMCNGPLFTYALEGAYRQMWHCYANEMSKWYMENHENDGEPSG